MRRTIVALLGGCLLAIAAGPAAAQLPDAATLLADLGLTPAEIADVQAGKIVRHSVPAASDRELTVGMAFQIPVAPAELVKDVRSGLVGRVDPTTLASGSIGANASADLAKLTLAPNAASRAAAYVSASPGGDLNLSGPEIAAFQALGAGAAPAAVAQAVRSALVARLQAYQSKGLAGIPPYARSSGERSAGEELRTASKATQPLAKYAPAAYAYLTAYPSGKPPGADESFRWSQFDAHGTPTIALTHGLFIPEGDAWLVVQRQFYVSTGYNCEQAVAAFLPVQGGTVVVYGNRTSTDQITGFGGSTKRSLGSKILASQLEDIFQHVRGAAK
jgi:hypothetical protein